MRSRTALLSVLFPLFATSQQVITGSFLHGGLLRDYRLYIPAMYNAATPVPVVFNLHGYTSNNLQQEFYGDFRPIADTANFIIAHPNGTIDGQGNRGWNTFGVSSVDDLGFITALLDTISAQYNVDPDRVYSTGMSNGGFMSYDLACFRSDRFAAVASVTGSMIVPRLTTCAAGHPMPVMQIHGTADPTVSYTGGGGLVGIDDLVSYWVQFNNCATVPAFTAVPDISTTDGCTAEHYVYENGDAGSTVEFFKVIDGGHTWPGTAFAFGVTNQDFSSSKEIWRFFSRYRLSELQTGIREPNGEVITFTISPNPSSGAFHIRFEEPLLRTVTLTNAVGKQVQSASFAGTEAVIRAETPGAYLLTIQEGEKRSSRRVVQF
ncbi:MAG: prolyl oligopeptidase family serine peptidase [Flavobacteriales bacterium]|nr:prolyl oligopeptidase family serine peptidase [Flavobacteriales bacterium]